MIYFLHYIYAYPGQLLLECSYFFVQQLYNNCTTFITFFSKLCNDLSTLRANFGVYLGSMRG